MKVYVVLLQIHKLCIWFWTISLVPLAYTLKISPLMLQNVRIHSIIFLFLFNLSTAINSFSITLSCVVNIEWILIRPMLGPWQFYIKWIHSWTLFHEMHTLSYRCRRLKPYSSPTSWTTFLSSLPKTLLSISSEVYPLRHCDLDSSPLHLKMLSLPGTAQTQLSSACPSPAHQSH